jgi:hypothetical protein
MSNDRINELPICAKLTRDRNGAYAGPIDCLVNPDGPEAAALLKELVEALERIRQRALDGLTLDDSNLVPLIDAALAKARAQ